MAKRKVFTLRVLGVDSLRKRAFIETNLRAKEGIYGASVSAKSGVAAVCVDPSLHSREAISSFINRIGYNVDEREALGISRDAAFGAGAAGWIAIVIMSQFLWPKGEGWAAAACGFFGLALGLLSHAPLMAYSAERGEEFSDLKASSAHFAGFALAMAAMGSLACGLDALLGRAELEVLASLFALASALHAAGSYQGAQAQLSAALERGARRLVRAKKEGWLGSFAAGLASAIAICPQTACTLLFCAAGMRPASAFLLAALFSVGVYLPVFAGRLSVALRGLNLLGARLSLSLAAGLFALSVALVHWASPL